MLINDCNFEVFSKNYSSDCVITLPITSELEEGKERDVEEMIAALEKVKAVYGILFPSGKPDALVSESTKVTFLCGGDDGDVGEDDEAVIEALGEMLETPIVNAMVKMRFMKEYEHPFETEVIQIPDAGEGSRSVKLDRERAVAWVGDKPCDPDPLFRWLIAGVCPKKVGLVSFESECVMTVSDGRCYIVFADEPSMEKGRVALGELIEE